MSAITPPVALAAYAAATISGADPNETAIEAMRLGFVKLLVPFLFVTMPGILLIGSPVNIITAIILTTLATTSMSIGFSGWLKENLSFAIRGLFIIAAIFIAWPVTVSDTSFVVLAAHSLGCVTFIMLCIRAYKGKPTNKLKSQALG